MKKLLNNTSQIRAGDIVILESNSRFDILTIINEKKKLFLGFFLLLMFILLFNIILYQIVYNFHYQQQASSLTNDLKNLELLLDTKKTELVGYVKSISRFPNLKEADKNPLLKRRLYNLHSELNVRGIEIYDSDLNAILQTGFSTNMKKGNELSDSILQVVQDGYGASFFGENDFFDIQITAANYIYDDFSANKPGIIVATSVISKEFIHSIAYNIDGIIQFYKLEKLEDSEEKLLQQLAGAGYRGKGYFINDELVNQNSYIVGYLPVTDFYNQTIGYYTILKPQVDKSIIFYKISLFTSISILFISICSYKIKFGGGN